MEEGFKAFFNLIKIGFIALGTAAVAAAGFAGYTGYQAKEAQDNTVGVRLTGQQQELLSRGQLCQADLQEAFTRAQTQNKGERIVTLSQTRTLDNCPAR